MNASIGLRTQSDFCTVGTAGFFNGWNAQCVERAAAALAPAVAGQTAPWSIKVRSAKVPVPVSVRYAWQDNPENATLVDNASKLPAHPFEMHVAEDTNPAVGTVKGGR